MSESATFLHITDTHISSAGTPHRRDDLKVSIPDIAHESREEMLDLLLHRLSALLGGRRLDGVLFSGDAQDRGKPGGHELLLSLFQRHLGPIGITPDRIVATPGNHDVPRGSEPSSAARYDQFTSAWRKGGCVTPWLDGVDHRPKPSIDAPDHRLLGPNNRWVVYPINTCNWSHVTSILPEPLATHWTSIPKLLARGDDAAEALLRSQLEQLARYDMARVSKGQLEALRTLVEATPQPVQGPQFRLAVMHHHLRSPSLREEIKPFADICNVEQLRALFRSCNFRAVLHGHKHEHGAALDHIYDANSKASHVTLVISGATFSEGNESDAARLVTISGLPYTPTVEIEPIPLPRHGVDLTRSSSSRFPLWATKSPEVIGTPVVVTGSDLKDVYQRAREAASTEAANETLIVHLDLPENSDFDAALTECYPDAGFATEDEKRAWLRELVSWWQLKRSQLEHRIPYIHGTRLRRYGGKIDQISRIIQLLRMKPSTRAVAVLVDPFRDFGDGSAPEEFASFCLVEFRRRRIVNTVDSVDAIAFYRAQEFARWWPINVAELRSLQMEISKEIGLRPGRITTIAGDARTISPSPTQVAMPIVDRWLDQAPEKLYILANALVNGTSGDLIQQKTVSDWQQALDSLRQAAREFNSDGIPVAIEGLSTLALYMEAAESPNSDIKAFSRRLRDLARANTTFENSCQAVSDFESWSSGALECIDDLRKLTEKCTRGAISE